MNAAKRAVFNVNSVAMALGLGQMFVQAYNSIKNQFKQSKKNAKVAGKLLACALVLR